ncbi:Rha family transcriptional regulator [Vibrio harveyi]|uniref:Rha family transcriptional regulator n=1 Tax=Vibrio harveyi TaxID=669 RepID=UPI003BB63912
MSAQTTLPIEQYRPEDLVFVSQTNTLSTDSFLVAKYFGKRHDNVIQKIKSLDCSLEFTNLNFKVCHKNNELQNNKLQPFYQMTKDGFMFLVMGFTGKKAAAIKEAYINAFNVMAAQLTKQPEPQPALPLDMFTSEDELMEKFKKSFNTRILFDIQKGQIVSSTFVPDDAFICNKSKFTEYLSNERLFTNQEVIKINLVLAKRICNM